MRLYDNMPYNGEGKQYFQANQCFANIVFFESFSVVGFCEVSRCMKTRSENTRKNGFSFYVKQLKSFIKVHFKF